MTVTILLQFNCYEPRAASWRGWALRALGGDRYDRDRASIWLYQGRLPDDGPPLDELPGLTRITGPVPLAEAERVGRALAQVLAAAGVTVIEETTADD